MVQIGKIIFIVERLIITSPEEIEDIVRKVIKDYMSPKPIPVRDVISLTEAVAFLNESGYPTGKGTIYKLTSANKIPYKKYGNKLMFSRKELQVWVQGQVVNITDTSSASISLVKSASKRKPDS